MTRLNTTSPRASVAICKGKSPTRYITAAGKWPDRKALSDAFTSAENTAYTALKAQMRRMPSRRGVQGARVAR